MRSKVHPKYKTKYRVGNWSAYEQALVQRGDVTLWLSADATDAWRPSPSGRPGAPKTFSDCAIETALTLRLVFRLPLRQAEGFLRSVLSLMGVDLAAPDHTTLSRRSQSLAVEFRRIPSRGPIHLIVDSTGLSIVGEGEWAAVKHGGRGHRGWKTLHLAVDRVGVIVAHALTEPTVDDATIGIDLIETVDDEIARVTADAAYDTVAFYEAAEMRDATVVVPPSKTARVVDFHDTMPRLAHRAGQAGAVAASAFDAERLDGPVGLGPRDQGLIATRISDERLIAKADPPGVDRHGDVDMLVRIHADNHLPRLGLGGHALGQVVVKFET